MDLKELDFVDPSSHWYYQSKLTYLKDILRPWKPSTLRVLDVGAGSGFFSMSFADLTSASSVICVDPNYSDQQLLTSSKVKFTRSASNEEISKSNLFMFIDVLEHVEDDVSLLQHFVVSATPGSVFVISVPAFNSLWSGHDDFLEHKRRYRLGDLEQVARRAGLEVKDSTYWFGTLFLPVWLRRRWSPRHPPKSDMQEHPAWLNTILSFVALSDRRLPLRRWFGLSCGVVAIKAATTSPM